jgi:hypothetical protein
VRGAGDSDFAAENILKLQKYAFNKDTRYRSIAYELDRIEAVWQKYRNRRSVKNPSLTQVMRLRIIWEILQGKSFPTLMDFLRDLKSANYISDAQVYELEHSYKVLLRWRVHLDLFGGRNDKELPEGEALIRFVKSDGYDDVNEFNHDYREDTAYIQSQVERISTEIMRRNPQIGKEIIWLQESREQEVEEERLRKEHAIQRTAEMTSSGNSFLADLWARRTHEDSVEFRKQDKPTKAPQRQSTSSHNNRRRLPKRDA